MIQAAINSETGEFLGLIIPKEDLSDCIAIHGSAADWDIVRQGGHSDRCKVIMTTAECRGANVTVSIGKLGTPINLECPPGGQTITIAVDAEKSPG